MSDQELRRWAIEQAIELNRVVVCDVVEAATAILDFVSPSQTVASVAAADRRGEWTPERRALLRDKWSTTKTRDILALLNGLPGRRFTLRAVSTQAAKMGLHRQGASPAQQLNLARLREIRAAKRAELSVAAE